MFILTWAATTYLSALFLMVAFCAAFVLVEFGPVLLYPIAKPINSLIEHVTHRPVPALPAWWGPVVGTCLVIVATFLAFQWLM